MACASSSVSLESGRPAAAAASCSSAILGGIDACRRAAHDLADQRAIAHAGHLGHVRQIGVAGRRPASGLTSSICARPAPSSRTSTRPASRQPRQRQVASATSSTSRPQRARRRASRTRRCSPTASCCDTSRRRRRRPRAARPRACRARARRAPVPRMPTVNSRPLRYSSTSTGWRYCSSSSAQTSTSAAVRVTSDFAVTPLLAALGDRLREQRQRQAHLARPHGSSRARRSASARRSRAPRASSCPCAASARRTSGSEKVYGMPYASSSAGTCDSRPKPATPSAMLKTRSQRRRRRAARRARARGRCARPRGRARQAPAIASIVFAESNSATSCSQNPSAR